MKKGIIFFKSIILICVLILLFACCRWAFFNVIKKNSILDGLVDFRKAVTSDMENGKSSSVYYVKNVNKSDVRKINEYIDSAYGNVETYSVILESGEYLAIRLNFVLSDNYFVIRKYLYNEEIPDDRPKAKEIYNVIKNFIDSGINNSMSDFDKEIAVHDFIISNCVYGFPPEEEDAYTSYGVLVSKTGVCDGYAEAFFMFMSCLGIECDIVVGDTSEGLHAWNQIKLGDEWYHVDLTWDDSLPDMGSYLKHTYVNLNDEIMRHTHNWEEQFYNSSTQDAYNYYKKNFNYYTSFEEFKDGVKRQYGKSNVLEAAIEGSVQNPDLSFLFGGGVRTVNYVIEEMGNYSVLIVYLNK